jgi:hypothetical protein
MVKGLSIINYKGKEIIYLDYSGFANDKTTQKENTLKLVRGATEEYMKHPLNSILAIVNVENFLFDMDVLNAFKSESAKYGPYEKKVAMIGLKGLVKAGYNFVVGLTKKNYKICNSEIEAKEWLVSD